MYSFVICLASLRWRHVLANRKWWNNKNNNNDNDNLKITFSPFHFFPLLSNLPTPFFFLSHFPSPPFSLSTHFPSPCLALNFFPHSTFFWPNSSPPLLSRRLLTSLHPFSLSTRFLTPLFSGQIPPLLSFLAVYSLPLTLSRSQLFSSLHFFLTKFLPSPPFLTLNSFPLTQFLSYRNFNLIIIHVTHPLLLLLLLQQFQREIRRGRQRNENFFVRLTLTTSR